jgi:hypothetical protein
MSMPFVEFQWISFSYYIVTKYNIFNIIKGFYIVSPFLTRLSKDSTLIEYTCCPSCCVAPNVPVYFDTANKISCAVVHCRVRSRFSYFLNITSLTGKSKTQLLCAILQTVFSCKYYVFMFCNIAVSC